MITSGAAIWDKVLEADDCQALRRVGYSGDNPNLRQALNWLQAQLEWKVFGVYFKDGSWHAKFPPWVKLDPRPLYHRSDYSAGYECFSVALTELRKRYGLCRPDPMDEVYREAEALRDRTEAFLGFPHHEKFLKEKVRDAYVMGARKAIEIMKRQL